MKFLKINENIVSHAIAVTLFIVISIFSSKHCFIEQISQNIENNKEAQHTWSENYNCGVPTCSYQNTYMHNIIGKAYNLIPMQSKTFPFIITLLLFISFYIAEISYGIAIPAATIGSIIFGLATQNQTIIHCGHFTTTISICMFCFIVAGLIQAYKCRRMLLGFITITLALAIQIFTRNILFTYFITSVIIIFITIELLCSIKTKQTKDSLSKLTSCIGAIIIAFGIGATTMNPMKEFADYGLVFNRGNKCSSDELISAIIPQIKGGTNFDNTGNNSATYRALASIFSDNASRFIDETPMYFGNRDTAYGSYYIGIVAILLFTIGLIIVKGKAKWMFVGLLTLPIITNLDITTSLILRNSRLPMYFLNFSDILVFSAFAIAFLSALCIEKIIKKSTEIRHIIRTITITSGCLAVLLISFIIYPQMLGISNEKFPSEVYKAQNFAEYIPSDEEYDSLRENFINSYVSAVHQDRIYAIRSSAVRSLIFLVLISASLIFLENRSKAKNLYLTLLIFAVFDVYAVNYKYLGRDKYYPPEVQKSTYGISTDSHSRVCDLSASNILVDKTTSTQLNNVGSNQMPTTERFYIFNKYLLGPEIQRTKLQLQTLNNDQNLPPEIAQTIFESQVETPILNILNVDNFIYTSVIKNKHNLGAAWFVDKIIYCNENEEFSNIQNADLVHEAVIIKDSYNYLKEDEKLSCEYAHDSLANIELVEDNVDELKYRTKNANTQLAVFSEIFYPYWSAKIDGNDAKIIRANYLLRAVEIPGGEHEITFKFDPPENNTDATISLLSNIVFFVCIFLIILSSLISIRRKRQNNTKTELQ